MNIELQKLELIKIILGLQDHEALVEAKKILHGRFKTAKIASIKPGKKQRQFGFAKGMTLYIAPDFDDIPVGFEEYMQANLLGISLFRNPEPNLSQTRLSLSTDGYS